MTKGLSHICCTWYPGAHFGFPNVGFTKVVERSKVSGYSYAGVSETMLSTVNKLVAGAFGGVQFNANQIKRTNPVDQYSQLDFEIGLSEKL